MDPSQARAVAIENNLQVLDELQTPCWLYSPLPGLPYCDVLWANEVLTQRLGRAYTREERNRIVDDLPQQTQDFLTTSMRHLHDYIVVKGSQTEVEVRTTAFLSLFDVSKKQDETVFFLVTKPKTIYVNGEHKTVCFTQVVRTEGAASSADMRAAIMHQQNPIHSYLFDSAGNLLMANSKALRKQGGQGLQDVQNIKLRDVLQKDGHGSAEAATAALKAIFEEGHPTHRVTLCTTNASGKLKWTTYEMWRALDTVAVQPAVIVNTFNATHQMQLEDELEKAREQLLRQNSQLEASNSKLEAHQAKLERQQAALKTRLKQALRLAKAPRTNVDTLTIADKAVALLDGLLEGESMDLKEVMAVRNAMVVTTDLRQPMNLGDQLLHRSGLSSDVGQAMIDLLQGDSHSGAKRMARSQLSFTVQGSGSLPGLDGAKPLFDNSRRLSRDVSQKMCLPLEDDPPGEHDKTSVARDPSGGLPTVSEHQVPTSVVPVVERLLQEASTSFSFDVFELAEATDNRPLSVLGFYLLKGSGLVTTLGLHEDRLASFLRKVEAGYLDNPYHSRIHAAGVLQTTHMLAQSLIQEGVYDPILQLSAYMSAISHDFQHPGLTNDFLIRSRHELAIFYNDMSPLENMHTSSMFKLLYGTENLRFAAHMSIESLNLMRSSVIDLILGTDMKKHFSMLSRFQAITPVAAVNALDSAERHPWLPEGAPPEEPHSRGRLADLPGDAKLLVAQMALKVADIAHLAAKTEVHKRWTQQLTEEFFRQGDRERSLDMKISPLMDRSDSAGMVKSQVGFLEIVALPMFREYVNLVPGAQPILDGVLINYEYWRSMHSHEQPIQAEST